MVAKRWGAVHSKNARALDRATTARLRCPPGLGGHHGPKTRPKVGFRARIAIHSRLCRDSWSRRSFTRARRACYDPKMRARAGGRHRRGRWRRSVSWLLGVPIGLSFSPERLPDALGFYFNYPEGMSVADAALGEIKDRGKGRFWWGPRFGATKSGATKSEAIRFEAGFLGPFRGAVAEAAFSAASLVLPLRWNAPAGCPTRAQMLRRLRARGIGRGGELSPFVFEIQAPSSPQDPKATWRMQVQSPGAAPRSFEAASCEALAQAAVTILQLSWLERSAGPKARPTRAKKQPKAGSQSGKQSGKKTPREGSAPRVDKTNEDAGSAGGRDVASSEASAADFDADLRRELDLDVEATPVLELEARPQPRRIRKPASPRRGASRGEWRPQRLELGLALGATWGHLPSVAPALGWLVAPRWRRWSLRLRSLTMVARVRRNEQNNLRFGADFWAGDAELSLCAELPVGASWRGDLCAGGGPNYIWGRGRGDLARPQSQALLYWSYALSASWAYRRPGSAWSPHLLFRLSHAPSTPRFSVLGASPDLCCKQNLRGEFALGLNFDVLARRASARAKQNQTLANPTGGSQ